jgi:nitrogen regulatory protein P-II 1
MKKIEAIIDPGIFHEVRQALTRARVWDLVVSDVRCTDPHGPHTEFYRGLEYSVDFVPKVKLEVVIDDWYVDGVAEAISEAAALQGGASRVFVSPIDAIGTPKNEDTGSLR